MTFTDKINKALKEQGIMKKWLADKLKISASALSSKMKANAYTFSDIFYISSLLNLED